MKILRQNLNSFEEFPVLVDTFRKMNNLRMMLLLVMAFSISDSLFSQSTNAFENPSPPQNATAGTFQFASPTGNVLFWRMDFIESLYPGIESRREQNSTSIWHFNDDMDIIIFAKNIITASDFVPLNSPYDGIKEFKY